MSETLEHKDRSIEETLEELEALVERMENGGGSLEEVFADYESGVRLVKTCNDKIDKVEKQIILLQEEGENHGIS